MHIGLFLIPYQRHSGAGEYYHNLFWELKKNDTENRYTIFLPKDIDPHVLNLFGKENCVVTDIPSRPGPLRYVKTMVSNCVEKTTPKLSLLHCFNFPLPKFSGKICLTTYDFREEDLPETYGAFHTFFGSKIKPMGLKRADHIITISDFSTDRLVYHYPYCSKKVSRIYLGCNELVKTDHERLQTRPYLLAIGQITKHKNLETLIKAFNLCAKNPDFKHDLIIIGHHYGKNTYLEKLKALVEYKDRVMFTGRLSNEQAAAYYSHADIFIFPSLYEGFGIPLIEASQYKIPIIASRIPVFKEIYNVEDALFNPTDCADCARVINRVLENIQLQEKLKLVGDFLVKKYTTKAVAEETNMLYNKIMDNKE